MSASDVRNGGILGKITVKSEHEIEWTIENFTSVSKKENIFYNSPIFFLSGEQWFFEISPNGAEFDSTTGWISLFLCPAYSRSSSIVTSSFGVKKIDGKIEQFLFERTSILDGLHGAGYSKFLQLSELQRRKTDLLPSDVLTLTCSLWRRTDMESPASLHTLSQDLFKMLDYGKRCDVKLRMKNRNYFAHELILSARSSVFAAMFQDDKKEGEMRIVDIEDCDGFAFDEFLSYLYRGKMDKIPLKSIELYKIADRYNVHYLKSYCALFACADLSTKNILDVVNFGHQFNIKEVKEKTQKFFNLNFAKVLRTAEWKAFLKNNVSLAKELLEGIEEITEEEENEEEEENNLTEEETEEKETVEVSEVRE